MLSTVVLQLASELLASDAKFLLKNIDSILGIGNDDLAPFTVQEKADFYRRLANFTLKKDPESLAGILLLHWLDGKGQLKIIDSKRIENLETVKNYFLNEVIPVFLSQKKAFINKKRETIKGIKPRLSGDPNFPQWDGISHVSMEYEGEAFDVVTLDDFSNLQEKIANNETLSKLELDQIDVFSSLHSSGLKSTITVSINKINLTTFDVTILDLKSKIKDNYNWLNEKNPLAPKKLTLFNPDFENPEKVINPVHPNKEIITIFHKNALEVEKEKLAQTFNFETTIWEVKNIDFKPEKIII
jgi:hypothetical protein